MCSKKSFKVMMLYRLKNINHIFLKVLLTFDDKFSKKPALIKEKKNAVFGFIEAILKEYNYCKKVIKNILVRI